MVPNYATFWAAFITFLKADTAMQAIVGNPARIYRATPPNVAFPFCLITQIQDGPWVRVKGDTIPALTLQFNYYALDTSLVSAMSFLNALRAKMDTVVASLTVTNHIIGECLPVAPIDYTDFDSESSTAMGVCSYRLSIEKTA